MEKRIEEVWQGWKVIKKIGVGGFGSVYEIDRDVFGTIEKAALKVISIPQSEEEIAELYDEGYDEENITQHFKSYLEDIVKEYSLMLNMKGHPNVVYCDDLRYAKHEDGIGWDIFIKMELLTALTKIIGNGLSEAEIVHLGIDICNALVSCKKENIVHRDIKPQNIFVSRNGDYKLGDFGIAKISEKTQSGTKIGTFEYMPPEVYNGKPYGITADIYSLGLVLYWLLNERHLPFLEFTGKVPTANEKVVARTRRLNGEELPAPKNGSDELKAVVLKACAFNPADRYSSPDEFLAALRHIKAAEEAEAVIDEDEKTVSILTSSVIQQNTEIMAEEKTEAASVTSAENEPAPVVNDQSKVDLELEDEKTTAISAPVCDFEQDKTVSVFEENTELQQISAPEVAEPAEEAVEEASPVENIEPVVQQQESANVPEAVTEEPVAEPVLEEKAAPTTEDYTNASPASQLKAGLSVVRKVILSIFDMFTLYMMLWAYPLPRILAATGATDSDVLDFFGFGRDDGCIFNGIFQLPYDVSSDETIFPLIASIIIAILLVSFAMFRIIYRFLNIKNGLTKVTSSLFKAAYFMCTVWIFSSWTFYGVFSGHGDTYWLMFVFAVMAALLLLTAKQKTLTRYVKFCATYLIIRSYLIPPILVSVSDLIQHRNDGWAQVFNGLLTLFGFDPIVYSKYEWFFKTTTEMWIWFGIVLAGLTVWFILTKTRVINSFLSKAIFFGFSAATAIAAIVTSCIYFSDMRDENNCALYFMHILWLIILLVAAIRFVVGVAIKINKKTL